MSAEVEQSPWAELPIVCPHCGNHGESEGEWQANAWTPFKLIEEVVRSWEFAAIQDGSGSSDDAPHTLLRLAAGFFSISSHASTPATAQRGIFSPRVSSILRTMGRSCQVAMVETMPTASPRAVRPARWM